MKEISALHFLLKDKTIFRSILNEKLSSINVFGKVLDVAGGDFPSYRYIFERNKKNKIVEWLNMDIKESSNLTIKADITKNWPLIDHYFDFVFLINAIYIFKDPLFVLKEAYRVLKKDGTLVLSIPFLWSICPEPDDYCRYTNQWIESNLEDLGFKKVKIINMGGPFTSAVNILRRYLKLFFLFKILALIALLLDSIVLYLDKKAKYSPLGYVAVCTK